MIHSEKQIIPEVRDSKKMTARQREKAFDHIKQVSSAYGVGIVSAEEIDTIGLENATQKAMYQALDNILSLFSTEISIVIVDGSKTKPLLRFKHQRIKSGDALHYSIAAASVLAKVTRDRIMKEYARQYPLYAFEKHVGYGTMAHLEALSKHGPCPIHRKSFSPISNLIPPPTGEARRGVQRKYQLTNLFFKKLLLNILLSLNLIIYVRRSDSQ